MDDIDRASELEAQFTERSLAEHQHRVHHPVPVTAVRDCEDCGCVIPPERLAAIPGAVCCVDCQALREARRVAQRL
ncbi:TraR/DksA family transcriptional regulator [Salmonella enterica]|uniref:TraR/DksA family transcriptional regulator n=2 Tax=Salmonella enterica TaxID=28901 RepID=A0A5Z7XWY8_SALNE|nr:TraR/DksA family transcriptional regulator [Salmonella enterica]ECE9707672.1 TraR/DksA family transcriptional regulator [Salmonella enterica subsp. enterica serovar Litchfield]ECS7535904.1 TraR/DksA family transcriptional regulator [Salmonella enterica subsp. enterica serovar Newport]EDB3360222.1 TraR/DksA family transcriptional regulator [Salmonella enterica subsp. enterica serovar Bredeney]EDR4274396.1 TraR/DksA family transcriptional regulator [Salmonella enterica subsp. enterica serovar 